MLFSPDRYPSHFGAGGKEDIDFIRYTEWMWMKRCIYLFGFMLGGTALGLYIGLFWEEYVIDSVLIKGKVKVSNTYMYSHIGIKPGDLYNESKIGDIKVRIRDLAFLKEEKPSQIIFTENTAKLILYLAEKNVKTAHTFFTV